MTRMTRIFKAALYIPAYYTEGKKNPRHPRHPCLKDYLHAEGEPCSSATLVNYHLTKTYNFNEQACLETSSPAHQHLTIKWLFSRQHLRYADCTVKRAIL